MRDLHSYLPDHKPGGLLRTKQRPRAAARTRTPRHWYVRHCDACPGSRRGGAESTHAGRWRYLTTARSQTKIGKSLSVGVYSAVLHLAPADISGFNVCPWSTPGCRAACLNTAGRGAMPTIQQQRIAKTHKLMDDRTAFLLELVKDIRSDERGAHGNIAAVRLNGTSDLPWEAWDVCIDGRTYRNLMEVFPDVQFYDYTKSRTRVLRSMGHAPGSQNWPRNYMLTYSLSELPQSRTTALEVLGHGGHVAAVFRTSLPETWNGYPVIDATHDDARFLDPDGSVAGLTALGAGKRDTSGFVIDAPADEMQGAARRRHAPGRTRTTSRSRAKPGGKRR